jgi:hypothetical protein
MPDANVVIYSDSRASINAINAHLHQRKRVNEKLHAPLLDAICQHLTARAAAHRLTWLVKVKSHAGITGNEIADKVASAAADDTLSHDIPPTVHLHSNKIDYTEHLVSLPPWWPHITTQMQPDRPPKGTKSRVPADHQQTRPAKNSRNAIREAIQRTLSLGHGTLYGNGLQRDADRCVKYTSSLAWKLGTDAQLRTAILTRAGQLYNKKLEYRYANRPNPEEAPCSLCRKPDSVTHIVTAACSHPTMKAHAIQRHNTAVKIIVKQILKSPKAYQGTLVTDLGTQHHQGLPDSTLWDGTLHNRIPPRLLHPVMRTLRKLLLQDDHHTKFLVATHLQNTFDVEAL